MRSRRTRGWSAAAALAVGAGIAVSTALGAANDTPPSGPPSAEAVARQTGTPTLPNTPPPPPTGTTGPVPTVPPTVHPSDIIKLSSAGRCVRSVRIRLARPSGVVLKGFATRAGARVIVRRNAPNLLTIRVLPRKRFRLKVVIRANGKTLTRTRYYQPCARRR